ncbi:unnamed protein product, partial [Symbiodinium necroappetens]
QLSIDKGSWNVAGEVLLEDPPPFTSFTSHTLPSGAEVPFTKLVDARWMEIFLARLREVDLYLETRRKLGGGGSRRGEDGGAPPQRTHAEETPAGPKKSRSTPSLIRGKRALDDEQWAHVGRLEGMVREIICHSPVSAEEMGRVASKIENLEEIAEGLRNKTEKLAVLCRGYSHGLGAPRMGDPVELDFASEARGDHSSSMTAKPVIASRLEFGTAPKFDPAPYMDALSLERMILDARGPNLLEAGLNRWTQSLGCAEAILQMRLAENEILVVSGADLKDYYYHYIISHQRLVRNSLAGFVDESVARSFSCFEEQLDGTGPYRAALNSMAMGDLNSVEFGQLAHLSLSLQAQVFFPEEMLTLKSRAPRSSIAGGVVIDDLFIAEKIDRARMNELGSGTTAGALRLKRAEKAYVDSGLKQNFKKSFSEKVRAEVWGAEIDGEVGTCRPLTCRLIPVLSITVDIIKTKAATRYILSSIAGFFVAIFQFRRRCMSLLEEVFKVPDWLDDHKAFRIWPALEAELWMLVLVSPAVRFNLRSSFCTEVSATDASDSWEAEVAQEFPEKFVEELSRHSLRKSVWTKLLRPAQVTARIEGILDPSEELPGGESFGYHPVWQTLFRTVKFKEIWRRRIWKPRHINVHELRTLLAAERRRGLLHPGSSIVTASDSQVSLGAVLKGRSASPRLNGILRQSLPDHLSSDCTGIYAYVGTSDNPADDPTRHARVREAREAMPSWMERALGGSFAELEDFLKNFGLDTVSMLGLPPFETIMPLALSSPRAPRAERRGMFLKQLKVKGSEHVAEEFADSLVRRGSIRAEDLRHLSELLPAETPARGGDLSQAHSFSSGMFVHGGVLGLRQNCRSYPRSSAAVAQFVNEHFPQHTYTSFSFMTNVRTPPHRDSRNHPDSVNLVVGLSEFGGGGIWVADDLGEVAEEIQGETVLGKNLDLQSGAVTLQPRKWHFTREWTGDRVVLVLYTVRDYLKAPRSDLEFLTGLDFHLPEPVYLKFRSLKPPSSLRSTRHDEFLVAGKGPRLERCDDDDIWPKDGPVLDLPPAVVQALLEFDAEQFVCPKRDRRQLTERLLRPGFLDCYSGSRGVAHELAEASGTWVLTFDYARSPDEDLLNVDLQARLFSLIRGRAFLGCGAGPVCSSFSRAIRPPVRNKEWPLGIPGARASMSEKIKERNLHASFTASLASECLRLNIPIWVENPHGSYLWETPCWRDLLGEDWPSLCWVVDYRAFGTPWRKRTRFFVGGDAGGQCVRCPGCPQHQRLSGYAKLHRRQWTKVAEAYPKQINKLLAQHLIRQSSAPEKRRRLDLVSCAKCVGSRFGEAANPGPSAAEGKLTSLENVSLVTAATAKLQSRVVLGFEEWLLQGLSDRALRSLSSCAMAYCTLLRAYGDYLFRSGSPMYLYRHLLAFMQKNRLELRPYMPLAWDLLSRWERVQPVRHRAPMPEAVFKALFALGAIRGWRRWCAILGLAYFGIARAGEPLRTQRKDLLLPSDTLSPASIGTFMAVRSPKTAFRGKGRVQHICIKDVDFSLFLEGVYAKVPPDDLLYNGSPASFRKSWAELLRALSVPKSLRLTPGGLRGGGAVKAYREGLNIQDLMWRMRVRHAVTLESYLQEVAALSAMSSLPRECRRRVTAACVFYQAALHASFLSSG